ILQTGEPSGRRKLMDSPIGERLLRSLFITLTAKTTHRSRLVLDTMLMASFSALYAVLRSIPTYPMLGIPGATFKAGDIIAPLYGILLGPVLGSISIAFGTTMAFFTGAPPIFLGLDFLPAS